MINVECLIFPQITQIFFTVRLDVYKTVAATKNYLCKSVKSVGDKREEAGRMSKHPFRAMI
jgi:hypothetical protein